MFLPKTLGTVEPEYIDKHITSDIWECKPHYEIPFPLVTPPKGYWLTLGSGCYTSLATTNAYGITYNYSIDVIRQDFDDKFLLNVDQYVAGYESSNVYKITKMPPPSYHHPTPWEPFMKKLPREYKLALGHLYKVEGIPSSIT
jgi:hypothetical protein